MNQFKTHNCNELKENDENKEVILSGWVHSIRDHGGVIFVMLRDQHGLTQIVASEEINQASFSLSEKLKSEYVITVKGMVRKRTKETYNDNINTGRIEVTALKVTIINESLPLPFEIDKNTPVKDDSIKYRYLHLRRPEIKDFILKRYLITKEVRNFLDKKGFCEIETPILTKATPEGARDFLVPSRVFPGEFYALPQSPQQYKQLLMIAGFDKYFQIAKALRDEDTRADRQAEHTQIDMEMSFCERNEIIELVEELFIHVTSTVTPEKQILFKEFPQLTYKECMEKYGSDKPDLRYDLHIQEASHIFQATNFKIFAQILKNNGNIKGIVLPEKGNYSRKQLDELIDLAGKCGLKGLVWIAFNDNDWKSSAGKIISEKEVKQIQSEFSANKNDVILLAGDKKRSSL